MIAGLRSLTARSFFQSPVLCAYAIAAKIQATGPGEHIMIENTRTPVHLWIVAIVSLLWNSVGAFDYIATQTKMESYMSQFTAEQLDYFYGFPVWMVAAWAIAIWASFLGSVALIHPA